MIEFEEGCQLTIDEIAAVMALSGRPQMVGFRTADTENMTPERLWEACCRLMRDAMMTQVGGKFRLSRELAAVMKPLCQARSVLVLTPASDLYAQMIFYLAEQVCAMKSTPFGRFVLRPLERHEMAQMLEHHLELAYPREMPEPEDQPPTLTVTAESGSRELLEGARFLLERFDPVTGQRTGWGRVREQGPRGWLQWTVNNIIECVPLTGQSLSELLQTL